MLLHWLPHLLPILPHLWNHPLEGSFLGMLISLFFPWIPFLCLAESLVNVVVGSWRVFVGKCELSYSLRVCHGLRLRPSCDGLLAHTIAHTRLILSTSVIPPSSVVRTPHLPSVPLLPSAKIYDCTVIYYYSSRYAT
jgi:hypothetical protein